MPQLLEFFFAFYLISIIYRQIVRPFLRGIWGVDGKRSRQRDTIRDDPQVTVNRNPEKVELDRSHIQDADFRDI